MTTAACLESAAVLTVGRLDGDEFRAWLVTELQDSQREGRPLLNLVVQFSGEAGASVDEAVVVRVGQRIVSVCTIAYHGQIVGAGCGIPMFTGLWTEPGYRGRGHARLAVEASLARCRELGQVPVYCDFSALAARRLFDSLSGEDTADVRRNWRPRFVRPLGT